MYGKSFGVLNTATGISLLSNTGGNHILFVVAASMLVSGVAIFAVSFIISRKAKHGAAN